MTKKIALLLVAVVGVLTLLVPLTSGAKVPPVCVRKTAGPAHIQIGYCPK